MTNELNGSYQERAEKQFLAEGEMKSIFSMLGDTIARDQGYEDLRGNGCGIPLPDRQAPLASPSGSQRCLWRTFPCCWTGIRKISSAAKDAEVIT